MANATADLVIVVNKKKYININQIYDNVMKSHKPLS